MNAPPKVSEIASDSQISDTPFICRDESVWSSEIAEWFERLGFDNLFVPRVANLHGQ